MHIREENFSKLTSYDGHQQYRLPDKTRTDSKFGAKRCEGSTEDPMKLLKDQFIKVSKKMSEQETLIKKLKLSNEAQKKKLAEFGDVQGDVPGVLNMTKKKSVPKKGKFGRKPLEDYNEWDMLYNDGFVPVGMLKGFVATHLRQDIKGSDEVVVINDPDSTTGGTKKKKKNRSKKREDSNKESKTLEMLGHSQ